MVKIPFTRNDGYNPSIKCDNPIQETWIHKKIVKKTGSGEDDFIIEEKAVKIDEIDIQKSIQEEAKTTDLKYLLKQLLLTGDESIINQRQGFYGDITGVQSLVEGKQEFVSPEIIQSTLPQELRDLTTEELASMSDEDILKYIAQVRAKNENVNTPVSDNVDNKKEGD